MKQRRVPDQPLATLDGDDSGRAAPRRTPAPEIASTAADTAHDPEVVVQTILLSDIVDSPYQPRLAYDPERIDELGRSLAAVGQQEPIVVRILPTGKKELLSGHRRKRAALNIGWTEMKARVVVRTDEQAKKETLLQNEGREDLTEYERAKMYQSALDGGMVRNQIECAEIFATSQATVSKSIAMLDLPAPIIAMLEKTPGLFGSRTAGVIRELLTDYPKNEDIVIQAVERLKDGAAGSSLRGWVAQMVAHKTPSEERKPKSVITNRSNAPTYEIRSKPDRREVVITVKDKTIDVAEFEQWIVSEVRRRQEAGDQ